MLTIEKFSPESKSKWDHFVSTAKNGLFFFYRDFMDYHADRFKDHSLIIYKNEDRNEILAVFPANENDRQIISHGGLTFGSLVISPNTKGKDVITIFDEIKNYYKQLGFAKIIYKAIPYIFHKYPCQEDLYALYLSDSKLIRRDISSVIEISDKIEFSQSKKNLINRFIKAGQHIDEETKFERFWDLLSKVLIKFDTKPVHTVEEITRLKHTFGNNIRLFTVNHDSELLAGVVIFDFGNVVHTQYMANSDKGRKLGALDFINYHLINYVFRDKKYYSFGISTEENGRYLNQGLLQQKENMGGRAVVLDFYEIEL
ncbi:GNAT family N-acetyltransferase [Cloacibacterium normanense]|uniref:GNAT family N-acetyltransferase n=1 Tax=Cloacibacterium normanense TaxID=237258 RepID=UPI0035B3BEB2